MTEIGDKAVRATDKLHKKIALSFDVEGDTFSGTSGCNTLAGSLTATDSKLTLKPNKSLQICRVDQRTERALRGVLNDTRGYRLSGTTLELLDDKGQMLAKLKR